MTEHEREGLTAICLLAAFADGEKCAAERERIARIVADLGAGELLPIVQRVLLKRTDIAAEVARLSSPELRSLAYEMAVCVCDADGACSAAERAFLDALGSALGLSAPSAAALRREADAVAETALDTPAPLPVAPAGRYGLEQASSLSAEVAPTDADSDVDPMIVNYAVLTGALELLPQSMASLAIIPLQMKMVYRIGARFGVELDRGHAKELLATVGIGLTGQVVETFARKLLGGLSKWGGKTIGRVVSGAAGPAVTFATTYALGQVAAAYYAGGRSLSGAQLKQLFAEKSGEAKGLYARYRGEIDTKAGSIDVSQLVSMVRGQ